MVLPKLPDMNSRRFHQEKFKAYVTELQQYLFEDASFNEILKDVPHTYRSRRFAYLYLIQDKETFEYYYKRRKELGLEAAFQAVVSTLLQETTKQWMADITSTLDLHEDMVQLLHDAYSMKEFQKDLNSFMWYITKKELKKARSTPADPETYDNELD